MNYRWVKEDQKEHIRRLNQGCRQKQWHKILCIFSVFFLISVIGTKSGWCGETKTKERDALSRSIKKYLIEKGFCKSAAECSKKLDAYVGAGGKVAYSLYGISNRKMIAAYIEYVVEHGIEITQGVPVTVSVRPKLRKEYGNFLFPPKTIIKVEVRQ